MCKLGRWIILLFSIPAGAADSSTCAAQSREAASPVPVRASIIGKFAHYLESPKGDIDGIVLEDGTVARFSPLMHTTPTDAFRPGDSLRVQGDAVSDLTGPYLVHALVTRNGMPTTSGATPAQNKGGFVAGNASHRMGKNGVARAKGARESGGQSLGGTGKTPSRSTDRHTKVDEILVVNRPTPRTRKQGRLEIAESKARAATTGTGKGGSNSRWARSQETAGP
jgi:hypothetical protein